MSAAAKDRAVADAGDRPSQAAPYFLVTREDQIDDSIVRSAADLGYRVRRLALLATEPGADSATLERMVTAIIPNEGIAWTSRRAAEALARAAAKRRQNVSRCPLYAVGPESASPLRGTGLTVHVPEEPRGAAHLATYIAGRANSDGVRRVFFLHGDRALEELPQGLRACGIETTCLEVYRTRFLDADVRDLETALKDGAPVVVAFFSPSGVEGLERLLGPVSVARLRESAAAIARGATTFTALTSRGYRMGMMYPERSDSFERYARKSLETLRSRS